LKRGHNIKYRNIKYRPYAFTEHGAIMAATVLNSSKEDPSAAPAASGTRQDEDRLRCPRGETKILPEDPFEEATMTELRQQIADWYFWAKHLTAEGKIVPPPGPMRGCLTDLTVALPLAIQVQVAANPRSVSPLGQQRPGSQRNRIGYRSESRVWRMHQNH